MKPIVEQLESRLLFAAVLPAINDPPAIVSLAPAISGHYDGPVDSCRAPIEGQAWWTKADGTGGSGHLHLAILAPLGQKVSGVWSFPVRVVLHDNAAHVTLISAKDHVLGSLYKAKFPTPPAMIEAAGTRSMAHTVTIDTRTQPNGWHAVGVFAEVNDAGKRFFVSVKFQVEFSNPDRPTKHTVDKSPDLAGKPTNAWTANAWRQEVKYATIVMQPVPQYFLYTVTPIAAERARVTLDKGHVIPAVGEWRREESTAGLFVSDTVRPGELPQSVALGFERLAPGWHLVNVNALTNKSKQGLFLSVVAREWFYV